LILENLKSFNGYSTFQRRTLDIMTSLLSAKDLTRIRNAFYTFDLDFSGTVSLEEFRKVFEITKYEITPDEVDTLFMKIKDPEKN
jgi:Ca2+-binding EF-hand superfamily protein